MKKSEADATSSPHPSTARESPLDTTRECPDDGNPIVDRNPSTSVRTGIAFIDSAVSTAEHDADDTSNVGAATHAVIGATLSGSRRGDGMRARARKRIDDLSRSLGDLHRRGLDLLAHRSSLNLDRRPLGSRCRLVLRNFRRRGNAPRSRRCGPLDRGNDLSVPRCSLKRDRARRGSELEVLLECIIHNAIAAAASRRDQRSTETGQSDNPAHLDPPLPSVGDQSLPVWHPARLYGTPACNGQAVAVSPLEASKCRFFVHAG